VPDSPDGIFKRNRKDEQQEGRNKRHKPEDPRSPTCGCRAGFGRSCWISVPACQKGCRETDERDRARNDDPCQGSAWAREFGVETGEVPERGGLDPGQNGIDTAFSLEERENVHDPGQHTQGRRSHGRHPASHGLPPPVYQDNGEKGDEIKPDEIVSVGQDKG
jgi:hypothetical protein